MSRPGRPAICSVVCVSAPARGEETPGMRMTDGPMAGACGAQAARRLSATASGAGTRGDAPGGDSTGRQAPASVSGRLRLLAPVTIGCAPWR